MSTMKKGFTIIEVSLFLAITGLIFIGMIVGVQTSLTQNHYEDDVRGIFNFLQDAYSKVISVENNAGGTSDKAIYGKLITFGENRSLAGDTQDWNTIKIYDVVGDIATTDVGNTLDSLKTLNAKVTKDGESHVLFAGIADSYKTRWGSGIESTEESVGSTESADRLSATVLIVRSPATGSIFTYAIPDRALDVANYYAQNHGSSSDRLLDALKNNYFSPEGADVDICVNMDHKVYGGKRKNIRIEKMARSSAGVKIIPLDDPDNRCQ